MTIRIPDCHTGVPYSFQVTATPGLTITGSLPPGLQWNAAYGTITGTPDVVPPPNSTDWSFNLSDSSQWVICHRWWIVLSVWNGGTQPIPPGTVSTYTGYALIATDPELVFGSAIVYEPCPYPQTQLQTSTYTPNGSTSRLFTPNDVATCSIYAQLYGSLSGSANNDTPTQTNQLMVDSVYIDVFYGDGTGKLPYAGGGSYTRFYPENFGYVPSNGFGCGFGTPLAPSGSGNEIAPYQDVTDFNVTVAPGTLNSWAATTVVTVGQIIQDSNGNLQIAITASGTTGGTAPAWDTRGGITADGTVQWQGHGSQSFLGPPTGLAVTMCTWHFNPLTNYTIMQWEGFPLLVINCGNPPGAGFGSFYTHTFPASGGTPPYTFSIISGSLPPGLTLAVDTGTVAGTPLAVGTFTFTLQVTDSAVIPLTAYVVCSITVTVGGPWVIQEITAEFIPSDDPIDGHGHWRYTARCVNQAQAGTYLGFWASFGGSSTSGGGGSTTASGTAPGAPPGPPLPYAPVGGVNLQIANYTAVAADSGELISFNSATPVTLTLPSPVLSSTWFIGVQNTGSGTLTINPNGLKIDGLPTLLSTLTLYQNEGLWIFSDGTNYETKRGPRPGGVNIQTVNYTALALDDERLIGFNSSSALTLTLPNPPISSTWLIGVQNYGSGVLVVSPNGLDLNGIPSNINLAQNQGFWVFTDGVNYFILGNLLSSQPYDMGPFMPGTYTASQPLYRYVFPRVVSFPANMTGAQGGCLVNPTSAVTLPIVIGSTTITVSVSTGGVVTFSGAAVTTSIGTLMTINAPSSPDATFAGLYLTLVGSR